MTLFRSLLFPLALALPVLAHAAAPSVTSLKCDPVKLTEPMSIQVQVADSDSNLQTVLLYVSGPGPTGQSLIGTYNVSGGTGTVNTTWTPPSLGIYTITATVSDTLAASSTFSRTTQSFKDRELVGPLNLNSGEIRRVQTLGEIRTAQNDQASATSNPGAFQVTAQSGSSLVLWAQNRVVLKPGFRSMAGSVLWATVDANMNGYTDMEEATDSDGDGLCDAWEADNGLNPFNKADATAFDASGMTGLQKFANWKNHDVAGSSYLRLDIYSPVN